MSYSRYKIRKAKKALRQLVGSSIPDIFKKELATHLRFIALKLPLRPLVSEVTYYSSQILLKPIYIFICKSHHFKRI